MANKMSEIKFWVHPDGFVYIGDQIEGARAATDEEVAAILSANASAEAMSSAESEYNRATQKINALNEKMEDGDYSEGETEESIAAIKKTWTDYRIALRAYIKAADGTKELPKAPDSDQS
ncbi:hypothetical protein [Cronobacter sakazakii]|uniref:hypothetical protein n=1 Tax=Cronobacter sakazakii TaxID=28141 RepID=UPI002893CDB6|nr:hypothetical protein [Cronobacter sakazakii]MDT3545623.1 hypothetical protein [Cronobacter sakazakii]